MHDKNDEEIEYVSKSQMKREMHALQELGEKLVELTFDKLKQLNLPEDLEAAITQAKSIKKHGAKRRQLQYIGRLMRDVDADDIQKRYDNVTQHSAAAVNMLHKIEKWRDRLIEEGDVALEEFVQQFPDTDRQQLRLLMRTARQELTQNKPPKAYRKIFQLIKTEFE